MSLGVPPRGASAAGRMPRGPGGEGGGPSTQAREAWQAGGKGRGRKGGAGCGDTDIKAAGCPSAQTASKSGTAARGQAVARSAPEKTGKRPLADRHTGRRQASSQESSKTGAAPGEPGASGPVVLFPRRRGRAGQRCLGRVSGGGPYGGPSTRMPGAPAGHPTGLSTPRALGSALPSCPRRRPQSRGALAAMAPGPALASQPVGGVRKEEKFLLVWISWGVALGTVLHARRPCSPVPARHPPGLIRRGASASNTGGGGGAWRHPDSPSVSGQRQAPNGQSPLLGPGGAR